MGNLCSTPPKSELQGSRSSMAFGQNYKGVMFEAINGDIVDAEVEAIVNGSNQQLTHNNGIANSLVSKGGQVIQEESDRIREESRDDIPFGSAVVTSAGRLKAKHIIHVITPTWTGANKEDEMLSQCVINAMLKTNQLNVKSVAVPSLDGGILGFPKERAAEIIVQTCIQFIDKNAPISANCIKFVNADGATVKIFKAAIQNALSGKGVNSDSIQLAREDETKEEIIQEQDTGSGIPQKEEIIIASGAEEAHHHHHHHETEQEVIEQVIVEQPAVVEEVIIEQPNGVIEDIVVEQPAVIEEVVVEQPAEHHHHHHHHHHEETRQEVVEEVVVEQPAIVEEVVVEQPNGVVEDVIVEQPAVVEEVVVEQPAEHHHHHHHHHHEEPKQEVVEEVVEQPAVVEEIVIEQPNGVVEDIVVEQPAVVEEVIVEQPAEHHHHHHHHHNTEAENEIKAEEQIAAENIPTEEVFVNQPETIEQTTQEKAEEEIFVQEPQTVEDVIVEQVVVEQVIVEQPAEHHHHHHHHHQHEEEAQREEEEFKDAQEEITGEIVKEEVFEETVTETTDGTETIETVETVETEVVEEAEKKKKKKNNKRRN